jgi:hypothetical protein
MNDKRKDKDVDETDRKPSATDQEEKPPSGGKDDDPESDASEAGLKPVRPKIGESENNLKQRADWFQKRSGRR